MSRFLRFPFRFGSVPTTSASTTTSVTSPATTPSRWGGLGAVSGAWNTDAAQLMPRFEHVRWGLGRSEWNGGIMTGRLNYVVDVESGFIISSDAVAVISSEATVDH